MKHILHQFCIATPDSGTVIQNLTQEKVALQSIVFPCKKQSTFAMPKPFRLYAQCKVPHLSSIQHDISGAATLQRPQSYDHPTIPVDTTNNNHSIAHLYTMHNLKGMDTLFLPATQGLLLATDTVTTVTPKQPITDNSPSYTIATQKDSITSRFQVQASSNKLSFRV